MNTFFGWTGVLTKQLSMIVILSVVVLVIRQAFITHSQNAVLNNPLHKDLELQKSTEFIPLYNSKQWSFYSAPVFMALNKVTFDQKSQPVIDASFRRTLKQAAAKLPLSMPQQQVERLGYLIERQYPGQKGVALAPWLISYYEYRQAKQVLLMHQRAEGNRLELFRKLMTLREHHFGTSVAQRLYEHQYQFADNLAKFER